MRRVADTSGIDMAAFDVYEKALRKRVDAGKIPGYCSAVVYKGELLHSDAYGCADPKLRLDYGPNVIMRLYCMSKPFVAVGILILQERGLLSVNDPVAKHIPSFKSQGVVASSKEVTKTSPVRPKPFTILHCLTHTAGLPYGVNFNEEPGSKEFEMTEELVKATERGEVKSLAQFVDALAAMPLRCLPGKRYGYSYSVDVLGRVIEVVSGMALGKFLQKEVYGPLKMVDTGFSVPRSKARRLAAVYCSRGSALRVGAKKADFPRGKYALCRIDGTKATESRWLAGQSCKVESGGGFMGANMGGLVSTVSDSARFLAMLSGGGQLDGVRILKSTSVERYCLPDLFPQVINDGKRQMSDGSPFGWSALGEVGVPRKAGDKPRDTKDDYELGECGGGGAACTYWSINPSRDLAIAWFTQSMDNDPYVKESENIYLAARTAVPVSKRPVLTPAPTGKRVGKAAAEKRHGIRRTIQKSKAVTQPTTARRAVASQGGA